MMKVIRGINKIRRFRKPVVALGVFDGVHLGHRRILREAVSKAKSIKGASVVLTFWPHPQREESLYSLEHRLRLIGELGIDVCIVINFNKRFAKIPAEDFIKNILAKRIGVRYIYVGKNFRFGRNAQGGVKTLKKASKIYNFRLKVFSVVSINNKPISSTLIRALIKNGDLTGAQKLLGRPVSILGTVIKGISLGRKLGFPTANIDPHHEVIPPHGVYAVKIIFDGKQYRGACYIGFKPTFLNKKAKTIEVYIFNFERNIYGKSLELQFCKKIRDEKKFKSVQDLTKQIKKDLKIINSHFPLHQSYHNICPSK
jgi:riboflavin kinase/FMN adenylyltransferase